MINTVRTTSDGASDRRVAPRLAEVSDDGKSTTATESPPASGNVGDVAADEKESQSRDIEAVATEREAYSTFTVQEKRMIVVLVCLASVFSPLNANIYFPAIENIAADLFVTTELINLTITSYMILQAIAPMFFGDLADAIGRRPVYILDLIIYLGANIGLALQREYAALLVLRMVQSFGSSAVIALGSGVVADISHAGERGMYMGAVNIGMVCGPAIGPVIGGIISDRVGWWWIFWLLAIMASAFLIPLVLLFPETGRRVVGNGSIPARGLNASALQLLRRPKGQQLPPRPKRKKVIPNPLRCLTIILHKDVGIVLFTNSILYTAYYTITASIPSLFTEIYRFDSLQIGLCYLPFGMGCAIACFGAGKLMDHDYRVIAKKRNIVMDKTAGEDMATFPIEHARLRSVWWVVGIYSISIIAYGWVIQAETHLAGPLVLQFVAGLFGTAGFNILSTFVVDLYPMRPSSATASNNLVRCLMGAGGTAVIQSMINKMGRGWCFTFIGLVVLAMLPLLWMEWKWGMQWRTVRVQRAKLEKEEHVRQRARKREWKETAKSPIRV